MNIKKITQFEKLPQHSYVIAVSGQMAAGKNYICSQLEKQGWSPIDCDLLVHQAINQASEQIVQTFSSFAEEENLQIQNPDKTINRRELGKLLFKYPELLKKQEQIVYPIIIKMTEDFIASHEKTIINATVLYKTPELLDKCRYLIFVKAPFIKRLIRAKKRDKLPLKQIFSRFHSQKNLLKEYRKTGIEIRILHN